jgi:hypothetical protein
VIVADDDDFIDPPPTIYEDITPPGSDFDRDEAENNTQSRSSIDSTLTMVSL